MTDVAFCNIERCIHVAGRCFLALAEDKKKDTQFYVKENLSIFFTRSLKKCSLAFGVCVQKPSPIYHLSTITSAGSIAFFSASKHEQNIFPD